jgi:alkylation response protein AidB-like acyl-CoA dehydrogenase
MTTEESTIPVDLSAFRSAIVEIVASRHQRRVDVVNDDPNARVALPIVAGATDDRAEADAVEASRQWQRDLFDAGFGWVTGPPELGGAGLTAAHVAVVREVTSEYACPDDTLVRTGTQVLGPSLLAFGSERVRRHHLRAIHRGDELVCQLFSEPNAGSDLANIQTRATRVDGGWVLDGQKVWSSGALHADFGVCIARTDPTSSRHAGLTAFFVDMRTPGIDVRRIEQMTGGAEFCEVFFTGARVDDEYVIGEPGSGWRIVIDALMNERSSIGNELLPEPAVMDRLLDLVRASGDHGVRLVAADVAGRLMVARWLERRIGEPYGPGSTPGPELALTKLALTDVVGRMSQLAGVVLGAELVADGGRPGAYVWAEFVLGAPGLRIGGGTDEILKNGIGERVLGLPREPVVPSS